MAGRASGLGATAADASASRRPIYQLVTRSRDGLHAIVEAAAVSVLEVSGVAAVWHASFSDSPTDGVAVWPHGTLGSRRAVVSNRGLTFAVSAIAPCVERVCQADLSALPAMVVIRVRVDARPTAVYLTRNCALRNPTGSRDALQIGAETHVVDALAAVGAWLTAARGRSSRAAAARSGRVGRRTGRRHWASWSIRCPIGTTWHARCGGLPGRAGRARPRPDASWSTGGRRKRPVVVGTAGACAPSTDHRGQQVGSELCPSDHGLLPRLAHDSRLSNGRDRGALCRNSIRRSHDVVPL